MRYYIIAGEASGDLHGSNLMRGLYARDPEADIRFWGGALMDAVYHEHQDGRGLVHDYGEGAVIGFTQVFLHARAYLRKLSDCGKDILAFAPDVVILIDIPVSTSVWPVSPMPTGSGYSTISPPRCGLPARAG